MAADADDEGSVSPPRNDSTALRLSPNGALRGCFLPDNDDVEVVVAAVVSGRDEEHGGGGCGDAEDEAPATMTAAAAADRTADPRRLLAGLMAGGRGRKMSEQSVSQKGKQGSIGYESVGPRVTKPKQR